MVITDFVCIWVKAGAIFAIKLTVSISSNASAILLFSYSQEVCLELWVCPIFNKIINLVNFSALIPFYIRESISLK